MQVTPTALPAHLNQSLRSLYVVTGDDPLLTQEVVDQLRLKAREQGYEERTVLTFASARQDWGELAVAGQSMGLFSERKWLEVRIPGGKPGKEGSVALQELAQRQPDDSVLTVISLPRLDKATTESAWVQALMSAGVWVRVDNVERHQLPQWIAQRLAQQGQRVPAGPLGQQALQQFADRVEGNLLAAHQEILKLGLLYPAGELPAEGLDLAVGRVARFDPFRWSETVMSGRLLRAQRMLLGLEAEGTAAVLVHWTLAEDLRLLSQVHAAVAAGRPLPMAMREARVWGVREKWIERALPMVSTSLLADWLLGAHEIDGVIKGIPASRWPRQPWLALSVWSLSICQTLSVKQ